jgi:hypothetical protein
MKSPWCNPLPPGQLFVHPTPANKALRPHQPGQYPWSGFFGREWCHAHAVIYTVCHNLDDWDDTKQPRTSQVMKFTNPQDNRLPHCAATLIARRIYIPIRMTIGTKEIEMV